MAPTGTAGKPARHGRATRVISAVVALGLVAYALSDHPLYGGTPGFGPAQGLILAAGVVLGAFIALPLEWNKRALLAFFSFLFVLLVAELGVEALFAHRYRPGYRYDERLLFALIPDRYVSFTHSDANGGHTILSRINEAGYRGEELRPDEGQLRVAVYGDSFIHALYVEHEDSFVERLEGELSRELKRDVEAINAGVSSYGPDQLYLKMKDELPKLDADLVVLAVYAGNDFGDLLRNKLFRLDDAGRLQRNPGRLAESVRQSFEASNRESILKHAVRNALQRFDQRGVYAGVEGSGARDVDVALVDGWLEASLAEYRDYVIEGNNVVTTTHVDHYNADVSLMPSSESARYQVRLMEAVLARVRALAEARGVPLAFLFIPHPIDAVPDYGTGRVDRERYPDYRPENATDALAAIAERHGWPYLDLFDVYRGREVKALYFHSGDDHWNERGQKVAAQAMAAYLIEQKLLP